MPGIYVGISHHGFGHTTRTCSIVSVLQQLMPEIPITIATTAPQWLINSYLTQPYTYRPVVLDVGVIQSDGLRMDRHATLEKLQQLKQTQDSLISTEAQYIESIGIDLVFADIPALAVGIARSAGIECWMASNFGWDLIYRSWLEQYPQFGEIIDWIIGFYQDSDRLFRLPFCEEMPAFPHQTDVGLTGGNPKFSKAEIAQKLQFDCQNPIVLLSFGGMSLLDIPYHNCEQHPDLQFLTFDRYAPELKNLTKLSGQDLRPVDVMPLCDRVISKPGYSTIAEACRLGVAVVCLTRSGFPEADYLLKGLTDYMNHQIISPQEFYTGQWEFLHQTPCPPRSSVKLELNGEQTIAKAIADFYKNKP